MVSSPVVPAVLPRTSYAGLVRRIGAHFIDLLIALAVTMSTGFFMRGLRAAGIWTPRMLAGEPSAMWQGMTGTARVATLIAFIVSMGPFYTGILQASAWQASIGKRLLNIYVTDTAGMQLGLTRSIARSFAKIFLNLMWLGPVSVAMMIATARKQALHDYAVRTVVVNGRAPGDGRPELWRFVAGFGIQFLWFALTAAAEF